MRNDIKNILELYRSGMKFKEIKQNFGCDQRTIYYNLKKYKLSKRGRIRLNHQKMVSLYSSGLSASQVAREIKCSKSRVLKILHTNNVLVRPLLIERKCEICEKVKMAKDFSAKSKRCRGCAKTYMFNKKRHDQMSGGYVYKYLPGHHRANLRGYVGEHILVWEQTNNKKLPEGWLVHHVNGIKNDNKPRNLFGTTRAKHHILGKPYRDRIVELENKIKTLIQPSLI
jgi:hypothetical protein